MREGHMTVASVLQWPLYHFVWPLMFGSGSARAKARAQELDVTNVGELRILEWYQHIGYERVLVYSDKMNRLWYVNIRPVHYGNENLKVSDLKGIKYIELRYRPEGITDRHLRDKSTYLTLHISAWRLL